MSQRFVLSGVIWGQISRIGDIGLNLLFSVLIIRLLGNHDYGTYSTILSFPGFALILVGFGLSETLMRYVPQASSRDKSTRLSLLKNFFLIRLTGSSLIGLALAGLAPLLAVWTGNSAIA